MESIIKLLEANKVGALATSYEGKPYVRPQHLHFIKDGKFYFTTANVKKAYQQLKENPYMEFMVTTPDFQTIRLSGSVEFSQSIEEKEMVLEAAPLVKKGYQTADNPIFEVFYIEHGQIVLSDFSGNPPRTIEF